MVLVLMLMLMLLLMLMLKHSNDQHASTGDWLIVDWLFGSLFG